MRGRVEQQVDALAGSANKVLTGVVDTSFGVLRALLPGQVPESHVDLPTPPADADQSSAPWNVSQSRFGLLRRDTGFSIASITASLPGRSKAAPNEESGQQMIDVPSRPGSSRSVRPDEQSASEEEEDEEDEESEEDEEEGEHDTRSIRSFESMMSQRSRQARKRKITTGARKSITDRLASVPGLSRLSHGQGGTGGAAAKVCVVFVPSFLHLLTGDVASRRPRALVDRLCCHLAPASTLSPLHHPERSHPLLSVSRPPTVAS